jgi:RimJ/RimL family protein N-acetyltransferase
MIETRRLILRHFEPDDEADLHRILSDPTTMSFWPAPFSREASRDWLNRNIARYSEHGLGRLAVILKETNELIGDCGIVQSEIDGQPENDLGYIIFHAFWNRGYAAEAAEACKTYGFDRLKLHRICANMPVDHLASRRIAEKIGMRLEKEFPNRRNRNILTCLYAVESD